MKSFFQRKPDPNAKQTTRTTNEAYKIWLPRPELPRQRTTSGSSRPPQETRTSTAYRYATAQPGYPPQHQFYPAAPVVDRPESRTGYVPYTYQPQASVAPDPPRPSSSRKPSDKEEGKRPRREDSKSSLKRDAEPKKSKHRTREASETRKRKDSRVTDPTKERSSRKESTRPDEQGRSSGRVFQRADDGKLMVGKPPTNASSSSGKQTPLSRMPVYLPTGNARSQRVDNGLSESDTDHGTLSRGVRVPKHQANTTAAAAAPAVKETKSFWPFSRSKSAQKLPQPQARAESTPSKPAPAGPARTERRRHASDNAIESQTERVSRHERATVQDIRPTVAEKSRTMAFATQSSAPPPMQALPSRSSAYDAPPAAQVTVGSYPHNIAPVVGAASSSNPIQRSATPSQRAPRGSASLPPIYAPNPASRPSDGSMAKVSNLVAGFEARASETRPPLATARPDMIERKPSLSRIYAPPPPLRPQPPANIYAPPMAFMLAGRMETGSELLATKQPERLHSQLRDLLSDKAPVPRTEERGPIYRPAAPGPALYSIPKPTEMPVREPPIQVYSAAAVAKTTLKTEKPVENLPIASTSRRAKNTSSDSVEPTFRSHTRDDGRDGRSSRSKKEVVPAMKTSSRDATKPPAKDLPISVMKTPSRDQPIAVTKTPSKDSSRHTPSPVQQSTPPRFSERPPSRPQVSGAPSDRNVANAGLRKEPVTSTPHEARPASRTAISTDARPSSSRPAQRMPSEESILRTPSSLAHSVLQPTVSRTSIPTRRKGTLEAPMNAVVAPVGNLLENLLITVAEGGRPRPQLPFPTLQYRYLNARAPTLECLRHSAFSVTNEGVGCPQLPWTQLMAPL
ncbi:hypothetical protein C8F01DRAFT_65166 [Mycena amicta]|nr:hypothetical protein C8F01DRAFT_65166 [Mycena amicta]